MEVEEQSHKFPSFSSFVQFLTGEARIACNTITSLHQPGESEKNKVLRNRGPGARALATNSGENTVVTSCAFCDKTGHSLFKCHKFMDETVSARFKFVQEKKLCFSCLQSGYRSKECERRQTCSICAKKHPTYLHDDRSKERKMLTRVNGASHYDKPKDGNLERRQDKAMRSSFEAMSNRVIQNIKDTHTSTIIPVWVSTTSDPECEVLVLSP